MVVRSIGRNCESLVIFTTDNLLVLHLPLRNLKPSDTERLQARPHIIRHGTQVLTAHSRRTAFLQHDAQICFPVTPIRFTVFNGRIISRSKVRLPSSGPLEHFLPVQRQKFCVLFGPPWKCINAVKAKDVVDTKDVEDSFNASDSLSPPLKIAGSHCVPTIDWNTPILPPLLREFVVLEVSLRRRATRPVKRENVAICKHIRAVKTDAKRDVAHQPDAALRRKFAQLVPLLVCDPLHVTEKILSHRELSALLFG